MKLCCCPRLEALLNYNTYNAPQKELEEEFGLRTSVAPVESITREDTHRCFQVSTPVVVSRPSA